MKIAIVKRGFTCVNSRKRYNVGDTYEADMNRIKHLADKGYVVVSIITAHIPKSEVPAPAKKEVPKPKKKSK